MKNTFTFQWLLALSLFPSLLFSQAAMKLKLQLMPDGQTWGVYVKPDNSINPSNLTITGTAQVTVVMPTNYAWADLQSVSGTWAANAIVNSPIENPTMRYVSFGLQMDSPHITYTGGVETLLFTFKGIGDCPIDIHIIDNPTDPFNILPNSHNSNPSNELSIFDPAGGFGYFEYQKNYATSAWDCHDNDNDGIPNALEDTNGNGVYDPGVDASDLNEGNPALPTGCIKLKLQLLPDSTGWGVFAKPFDGYLPSANAVATGGRVTIVAPNTLPFNGFENVTGQWNLASTLYGLPSNPSRKYMTFELSPNATNLGLSATEATLLFTFDKLGDCPDSLYLMENFVPAVLQPNEFSGFDPNSFTSSGFEYCGVYARKAWRCKPSGGITPPIIIVATEDSLAAPQTEIVERDAENVAGKTGQSFTASPNPASDFVNIALSENLAEGRTTLSLWDIQGRKRHSVLVENTTTKLDLGDLPAGVYVVSLAQNGRVVERKKLIKN